LIPTIRLNEGTGTGGSRSVRDTVQRTAWQKLWIK